MILLLCGPRGSGKSTVALGLARRLSKAGIAVGGVICPGIFIQGHKIGIKCHYPSNGHEEIAGKEIQGWEISESRSSVPSGKPAPEPTGPDTFSYGRWEFRKSVLAAADTAILADIEASLIVFVDEIGPLELDHGIGMYRTLARLDAEKDRDNATIVVCARQDLAPQLTERWPKSILVKVTKEDPSAISKSGQAILMAAGIQWEAESERAGVKLLDTEFSTAGNTQS